MKQIVNILKRELAKQYVAILDQTKRVEVTTSSFSTDPNDQNMFNLWAGSVKQLANLQNGFSDMLTAYKSMCQVAGIPQVSLNDIVAEKKAKDEKRAERKAAKQEAKKAEVKKEVKKETKKAEVKKVVEPKAE
jgi:hypothetical protein